MTLSELKKLAQSATKGFWFFNREHGLHVLLIPTAEPHHIANEVKIADGKYIQAMQPTAALRMIELLEEAKDVLEELNDILSDPEARKEADSFTAQPAKRWLKDLEAL